MVTVLEARDADGELIGRCNERCHTAKGSRCTCICEGLNHGKGADVTGLYISYDLVVRNPAIKYVTRPAQRSLFTREQDGDQS